MKAVRGIAKRAYGFIIFLLMWGYMFLKRSRQDSKLFSAASSVNNKYIVITGGGFSNKGAQAMTFVLVDQLKKVYPDKEIILFSTSAYECSEQKKERFVFSIFPWDKYLRFFFLGLNRLLPWRKKDRKYSNHSQKIEYILDNAAFIADISGYSLSSQYSGRDSAAYLANIAVAEKYRIPFYVLPQSMGPYDYPLSEKFFLRPLLKRYLSYPEKVYVRERKGYDETRKFTKSNLELRNDIVLTNSVCDLKNIYKRMPKIREVSVSSQTVGVIPNRKVVERVDNKFLLDLYVKIIKELLSEGKNILLLRHSFEDLDFCLKMKECFAEESDVQILRDEYNAIEIENIIRQCDLVIASRYHSLVHAYKNHVPAIVIGWAEKYRFLLEEFNQLEYFFDCREKLEEEKIISKVLKMAENYLEESKRIEKKMGEVRNETGNSDFFNIG